MTVNGIERKVNWLAALGLPAVVFFACWLISQFGKFEHHTTMLQNALLVDLLVTAPVL
jgi:hypothetical protein